MSSIHSPIHPRGMWLRQRRAHLGLSSQEVAKALGLTSYLGTIEIHDLFIPPAWGKVLMRLGITESDTWEVADTGMRGASIRDWRNRVCVTVNELAGALRVNQVALLLVEARDWPVPPEWLQLLRELRAIASEPSIRKRPSWTARNEVVSRFRRGDDLETIAQDSGLEVSVVRLWARIAEIHDQIHAESYPAAPRAEQAAPEAKAPPSPGEGEEGEDDDLDDEAVIAESPAESGTSGAAREETLFLKVPISRAQLRGLNLLAQVFPERSASQLAAEVVAQFLRGQHTTVEGLKKVAGLGSGDLTRFDDPAEVVDVDWKFGPEGQERHGPVRVTEDTVELATIRTRTVSGVTQVLRDIFTGADGGDGYCPETKKLTIVVEPAEMPFLEASDLFPPDSKRQPRDVPVSLQLPSSVVEALSRLAGTVPGKTLEDAVEVACRDLVGRARLEVEERVRLD